MGQINIVNGNLLDAKENIIAHQVNCQGKFGKGIVKQIADRWQEVKDQYLDETYLMTIDCFGDTSRLLGVVRICEIKSIPNKYVANLYAQDKIATRGTYGNKFTDEVALKTCLVTLRDLAEQNNLSIALPYNIGCDLGGGDWNEIYKIIQDVFSNSTASVTLYKYTP